MALPDIVMLVGLPGSGKSTLAQSIVYHYHRIWRDVNQDHLGSRQNCINRTHRWLRQGYRVIIDRCNFDENQRRVWFDLAKRHRKRIGCLYFDLTTKECAQRIQKRQHHPTGVFGQKGVEILQRFSDDFSPLTSKEASQLDSLINWTDLENDTHHQKKLNNPTSSSNDVNLKKKDNCVLQLQNGRFSKQQIDYILNSLRVRRY